MQIYSGDFISPSKMSTITRGEHMVKVMNKIGIHCGMLGNHESDFGENHCNKMLSKLEYPTLNANLLTGVNEMIDIDKYYNDNNFDYKSIGNCRAYHMLHHNGYKIGIIGICENWIETLPINPENGILYIDMIHECRKYVKQLKYNENCDIIIVLTHSRLPNDIKLIKSIKDVDIVLGGHDHMYHVSFYQDNKTILIKSGTDFNNLSWIVMKPNILNDSSFTDDEKRLYNKYTDNLYETKGDYIGTNFTFKTMHYNITSNIPDHPLMTKLVNELTIEFKEQCKQVLGYIASDLDCRSKIIRTQETRIGNFISDVVRRGYKCDCVIINAGAIRGETIINSGEFKYGDILNIVPFQNPIVLVKVSGQTIINALECGFAALPKMKGCFPCVSGLKVTYNSTKSPYNRVVSVSIQRYNDTSSVTFRDVINGTNDDESISRFEPISKTQKYTLAIRDYLANGRDGFKCFKRRNMEVIIDEENGITMATLLRNFFWSVNSANKILKWKNDIDEVKIQSSESLNMHDILKVNSVSEHKISDNDIIIKPTIDDRLLDVGITSVSIDQNSIAMNDQVFDSPKFDRVPSFRKLNQFCVHSYIYICGYIFNIYVVCVLFLYSIYCTATQRILYTYTYINIYIL